VLAESMTLPDLERDELRREHLVTIEAGIDTRSTGLTASNATTRRSE
jgi:hypothetical protein